RTDVNSVTNWNAPLVWEGTFDPLVIDSIYKSMDPRIAVVVFAVGKYTRFLKSFLESGEKHLLVDFRVTYYVFTDHEDEVPNVNLGKGRKISVVTIPSANRWPDVVLGRMKWATITIDKRIRGEADYLIMIDVDSIFHNRVGAESLSRLSAVLHRGYYKGSQLRPGLLTDLTRLRLQQESNTVVHHVNIKRALLFHSLYCYEQSEVDAKNKIEDVWQEEGHLNKYLLYNKPTKVLSPEYLWSDYDRQPNDTRVIRISQLVKNYAEIRPNHGH
ncbi:globoside alpha-1,3-N-acetylgalactosaminyltransferase 1-like, partial [Lampris incognitus]|uniref:globoside alpha-1,3-N-acetylgalactosaminyltransferase 1-like n=1 Tax=Lampris incognitus TaxID=2546036 RepID=UPI0024B565CF